MNMLRINKFSTGVTLVELMIALSISSILLIGVVTIYGSSKRTNIVNDEFALLQENGRLAMKFIVEDVRMSGFLGCVMNDPNADPSKFGCYVNAAANNVCDNMQAGITGYNAADTEANNGGPYDIALATPSDPNSPLATSTTLTNWTYNSGASSLPTTFPMGIEPVAGSDILFVTHGDDIGVLLNKDKTDDTGFTIADQGDDVTNVGGKNCHNATGICAEDIVVVADCNKAVVFQVVDVSDYNDPADSVFILHDDDTYSISPGNETDTWGSGTGAADHFLQKDTQILKYRSFAYYIANNPNGQPALFRHDGITSHAPQELVAGVENMQVLYGVDTNDDNIANYYASANEVNFANANNPVVSVRVSLLVRSLAEIPKRPRTTQTYTLASTNVDNATADGRIRKIFTSTIKIRNKGMH